MGNTLPAHEDLVHLRGWTCDQIATVIDTLRRRQALYCLSKDDFIRYIGGRNGEAITVFNDLDTDYDGKVDIFEVLSVVTIFSGTPWREKEQLLFELFDMMGKGFLKVDELMLMGQILVQALTKFVKLESPYDEVETIRDLSQKAFQAGGTNMDFNSFHKWAQKCTFVTDLRRFVEDNAARGQPDSKMSGMRLQITQLESHALTLFERIEYLQDRLPDFIDSCVEYVSAWNRRKRWDFLMQNIRQLILQLQQDAEEMNSTLMELSTSLSEDEATGGFKSIVDPDKRFAQEQMLSNVDTIRVRSHKDFCEMSDMLHRLVELTEPAEMRSMGLDQAADPSMNVINEEEFEGIMDSFAPPRVTEQRNLMREAHRKLCADVAEGGALSIKKTTYETMSITDQGEVPQQQTQRMVFGHDGVMMESLQAGDPNLIAIADFDPPPSHQSQMLKLFVGEIVTVLGQDGRGWWYGKKANGMQGWFPPSYVQVKKGYFSSADPP